MRDSSNSFPLWLTSWMEAHNIQLWGAADLRGFSTPRDEKGKRLRFALSWVIPMGPEIMSGIKLGPNQGYADEYARANKLINELADKLSSKIRSRGFRAQALAASERTDEENLKGDFPHKTAATRSGLGWIGRHCQLITREFGPWVRLGTVFTDISLPCGPPVERESCGRCRLCVDACPAGALKGKAWYPGLPRDKILDVRVCDNWKKQHYFQYHRGHNCGICSAVCPHGLKVLKRTPDKL
jgi:epoxyqueuosine reductase QueG